MSLLRHRLLHPTCLRRRPWTLYTPSVGFAVFVNDKVVLDEAGMEVMGRSRSVPSTVLAVSIALPRTSRCLGSVSRAMRV